MTTQLNTRLAQTAQRPGTIIAMAAVAALLLTVIPALTPIAYPLRLLVTIVHELSHGVVGLLTGGSFERFVVFPNGSGTALIRGGWSPLVASAGYLGSAVFAAWLIRIGHNARWSRRALAGIGVVVLVLSLRYGVPSIFSTQPLGGLVATISGTLLGLGFLWASRVASAPTTLFLTNLIAFQAGVNAFSDLMTLVGISSQVFVAQRSDAQAMADMTFIPAVIWALLWAIIAAALIGGALWQTWLRPKR
jgi:hypothetical protein